MHKTEKSIRKIYAEKGYLNVKISSELSMPKKDLSLFGGKGKELIRDLTFTIEENRKVKIGKIIIDGNESISDLSLRWEMKETKRQPWYMIWRSTFDKKKRIVFLQFQILIPKITLLM